MAIVNDNPYEAPQAERKPRFREPQVRMAVASLVIAIVWVACVFVVAFWRLPIGSAPESAPAARMQYVVLASFPAAGLLCLGIRFWRG